MFARLLWNSFHEPKMRIFYLLFCSKFFWLKRDRERKIRMHAQHKRIYEQLEREINLYAVCIHLEYKHISLMCVRACICTGVRCGVPSCKKVTIAKSLYKQKEEVKWERETLIVEWKCTFFNIKNAEHMHSFPGAGKKEFLNEG